MYIVHSARHNNVLYHIMTIIYTSEQGTTYNVKCTTYNVQHTMYNVQHTCNVTEAELGGGVERWWAERNWVFATKSDFLIPISLHYCNDVLIFVDLLWSAVQGILRSLRS